MQKIHIVFSPHYDDAVFSMGGFLLEHRDDVLVVTVLGGAPSKPISTSWDRACGFRDSAQAIPSRIEENRDALGMLGVSGSSTLNWDFLDRQYRPRLKSLFSRNGALSKSSIVDRMRALLAQYAHCEIHAYAPLFGMHQDHLLIREALLSVFEGREFPDARFCFYEDLPYAHRFLSASGAAKANERDQLLCRYARDALKQDCRRISYHFSEEVMEIKVAALEKYRSQMECLASPGMPLSDVIRKFSFSNDSYSEHVHCVNV